MVDVSIRGNACGARGCGAVLSSNSRIVNCTVMRNRLVANGEKRPSVLFAAPGVQTTVEGLTALKNALSILDIVEGSLFLSNALFSQNNASTEANAASSASFVRLMNSTAAVEDSIFRQNSAASGSAVLAEGSNVSLSDTLFEENSALRGGVLFLEDDSDASLRDCMFASNRAFESGGAIFASESRVYGNRLSFVNNSAVESGGSLHVANANVVVKSCRFEDGVATHGGLLSTTRSLLNVSSSQFARGSASDGGCVMMEDGSQTELRDASFDLCRGMRRGGAVFVKNDSALTVETATFRSNFASLGGGCLYANSSSLVLRGGVLSNNSARFQGGCLLFEGTAETRVSDALLENNAAEEGGALYQGVVVSAVFVNVSFFNNSAVRIGGSVSVDQAYAQFNQCSFKNGSAEYGGLLHAWRAFAVNISNSVLTEGRADTAGCLRHIGGSMRLENVTLQQCQGRYSGGAVYLSQGVSAVIRHSSILSSNATRGSGIYVHGSELTGRGLTLNDSVASDAGGGLLIQQLSRVHLTHSSFGNNSAQYGGAAAVASNSVGSFEDSLFTSNSASAAGGAVYVDACNVSFTRCVFSNGTSDDGGFIRFSLAASIDLRHSVMRHARGRQGGCVGGDTGHLAAWNVSMQNCEASASGGAFYLVESASASISNSSIRSSTAKDGGGFFLHAVEFVGDSLDVNGNVAANCGGGFGYTRSSKVRIQNSQFRNNLGRNGGAVCQITRASGTFVNVSFANNAASANGGCFYMENSTLSIAGSRFAFGKARLDGGFISTSRNSSVLIRNASMSNGTAKCGGAVSVSSSIFRAKNLRIFYCQAQVDGGAFMGNGSSRILFVSSRLEGNFAERRGGAVSFELDGHLRHALQISNSTFVRNNAKYGGGVHVEDINEENRCFSTASNCTSFVALIGTTFSKNRAETAGGAIFSSHLLALRLNCTAYNERSRRLIFYDTSEWTSLDTIRSPGDICPAWTGNTAGVYGQDVATYASSVWNALDVEDGSPGPVRDAEYVIDHHRSGTALPKLTLRAVDDLDQGPAIGAQNDIVIAVMSSPDGFFPGSIQVPLNVELAELIAVGFALPGTYTILVEFSEDNLESFDIVVNVQQCVIGEIPSANGTFCEPCGPGTYNFQPHEGSSCQPCPEHGNCETQVILPDKGYWHPWLCSEHLQRCLPSQACDYSERKDALVEATEHLESCTAFDEETISNYSEAQCREGHEGPLCGSCKASYGKSHSSLCERCFPGPGSVALLCLSLAVLLGLSSVTVRSTLLSTFTALHRTEASPSRGSGPPVCPERAAVNEQMVEMIITGYVPEEVMHPPSRSKPNSTVAADAELAKWKSIELLKIMVNFLQVTAVVIAVNVEWTGTLIALFETAGEAQSSGLREQSLATTVEFISGITSVAVNYSADCLMPDASAVDRSIGRSLLDLCLPLVAICLFTAFWLVIKFKYRESKMLLFKRVVLSMLAVLYISYLSLTKTLIAILNCIEVHDALDVGVDSTTKVWAVDTGVQCYEGGHAILVGLVGWPFLFAFTVGFPLIVAYLIVKNAGDEYKEGWIYEVSGFMYRSYRRRFLFWESIIMFRKAVLAVIVVLSYRLGANLQQVLAVFVLAVALYFQMMCRPYRKEFDDLNEIESLSVLVSLLTFVSSIFFVDERVSNGVRILVTLGVFVCNTVLFLALLSFILIFSAKYLRTVLNREAVPYDPGRGTYHILKVYLIDYLLTRARTAIVQWLEGTKANIRYPSEG